MSAPLTKKTKFAGAAPVNRSADRDEDFPEWLSGLQSSVQKSMNFVNEIKEFQSFKQELDRLKRRLAATEEQSSEKDKQIQEKAAQIEKMEEDKKMLRDLFSDQSIKWDKDRENHDSTVKNLKATHQNECSKTKKTADSDVEKAKKRVKEAVERERAKDARLSEALAQVEIFKTAAQNSKSELYNLKEDIGFLPLTDELLVT